MKPSEMFAPVPLEQSLRHKMDQGQFVLTVEMVPPKTPVLDGIANRLGKYFAGHADGINVTDCASAMLRMSSLGASILCLQQGLDPVMQITCRDRNRIALQSELISAYAFGVRNILCLSGDHVSFGDHPEAKPVFDYDSTNLIATVSDMRAEGNYASGDPIKTTAKSEQMFLDWLIGAASNPFGNKPEHLARHMNKKCRSGADFLQTQPVFDLEGFDAWWKAMEALELPRRMRILPGILPPKSARALAFMKDNVPGMHVPQALVDRMEAAGEDAQEEGKRITMELIDALLEYPVGGLHVYPVHYEAYVPELSTEIRRRAAAKGFVMAPVEAQAAV